MKEKLLTELIEPVVADLGYQLWGLEYLPQKGGALLRIYIDAEKGIDVSDCARCSHEISGVMEVEDPIASAYTLEVSSPGLDRLFFKAEQFADYIDDEVRIKLATPVNGVRKLKGFIAKPDTHEIRVIGHDELAYDFDMSDVMSARLIPNFGDKK
ncbi:ribosome maturation factor RimP [Marinicella sp. W31]|uniref:ribosome maturation factor RimP n=1 Tax=Marinicella sp. W31 TaxID=3023713 RepID=UPI0037573677